MSFDDQHEWVMHLRNPFTGEDAYDIFLRETTDAANGVDRDESLRRALTEHENWINRGATA